MTISDLKKKALNLRLDTLKTIFKADFGYAGACMSAVEILTALYYGDLNNNSVMKFDPKKPQWSGQDYFILSKISAVPVQYCILADLGFFDKEELLFLGKEGALLKKYPDKKIPGIMASIQSEGCGLSVALGVALALKMERKNNKVFCLIGNEELLKGQIWEAVYLAEHYRLDNLILILDDAQCDDGMRISGVQEKFKTFFWDVIQVLDGHDFDKLLDGFYKIQKANRRPTLMWCHTVSGKGIYFAERRTGYLKAHLSEGEISHIIPKLESLI